MRNSDIVCSAYGGLEWGNIVDIAVYIVDIAVYIKSLKEKINKQERQMTKSKRISCLPDQKNA